MNTQALLLVTHLVQSHKSDYCTAGSQQSFKKLWKYVYIHNYIEHTADAEVHE